MGSITKSLTALAVIQLAKAIELSLEGSVNEYLDHYEGARGTNPYRGTPDPRLMDDIQLQEAWLDSSLDKFTRDQALYEQQMRDLEPDPLR